MATITGYPFVTHLRTPATSYVQHLAHGRLRHEGVGASFWFRRLPAVLSEVPVDDREQTVLVKVRASDLQEVNVPGVVTYRIAQPATAAGRVDFGVDARTGAWLGRPLEVVGATVHGAAADAVTAVLTGRPLAEILVSDPGELAEQVTARLVADPRLGDLGIAVVAVRFEVLRADPDVERALQLPSRELIQQEADRATFERRAVAVEREAAIGDNELTNQIELARCEEELISQRGANRVREAEDAAAADRVSAAAQGERTVELARAQARATEVVGAAEAEAQRAQLAAHVGVPSEVLMAMALRELAQHLPDIDQLVLTPDVMSSVLGRLAAGGRTDGTTAASTTGAEG